MNRLITKFVLLAVGALVVGVPVATAGGGVSGDVYGGTAGTTEGAVLGAKATGGTLPFTGVNLAFLVVGGLMLLATGIVLRRRTTSN